MLFDLGKYADRTAAYEGDISVTYSELSSEAERIASHIRPRSLVFHLAENTLGSLAGYVSFLNGNIVPVMIDSGINKELLDNLTNTYRPSYFWVPESAVPAFAGYEDIYSAMGYHLLDTREQEPYPLFPELALLITTSGSTGSPKLVRQSYKNLKSNTESIIEYLKIDRNERAITSLPMNYVYGLSVINTHLYTGAALVLTKENSYSGRFWKLFREKEATSFAGVPFMYETLNKLRITKKDIPSLKTMTQAGGKLSKEMQDIFCGYAAEHGKKFVIMYGASEATARMGYLPFEYAVSKRGSIGIPIPGGAYELVDADGSVITDTDKTGELVYRGDNVTLGYAACGEDLAKGDENHGRLETGDMAYRDADGFYYIAGRKKRFLKMLGKRLSLDEIEELLKTRFHTSDIACGGADDMLRIFVTDESATESAVDVTMELTGTNRALIKVTVVPEIPKNNSGKIMYSDLNELPL